MTKARAGSKSATLAVFRADGPSRLGGRSAVSESAPRDHASQTDPHEDPIVALRAVGHGPAHPAGQASRELGRQVRAWREARGLSQRDVAERLGWEQPHVARLELGAHTPNLGTLDRLARKLEIEVSLRAGPKGMVVELRDEGK